MTDGMTKPSLTELGFRPFFQQQLTLDELETFQLGRIIEQHRSRLLVMSEQGAVDLTQPPNSERVCVGDWVLFDEHFRLVRVLERQSLFQRKAAGSKVESQLIAANVDSLFIVCSLNDDFSLNRIERYLAIAKEAQVEPIVVLTKADQCENAQELHQQVQRLDPLLLVHALNALDKQDLQVLSAYCKSGQTVALLGSSGVGKSTVVNGLLEQQVMATGEIREDDSKGRHTTTYRAIKWLPQGGVLIDTPGMRELQLSECEKGIKETFSEIEALAQQCRFKDCSHEQEPGCVVQAAIESGELDERRLRSYQKLLREQTLNSASLAEKRARDKAFGKMVKSVLSETRSKGR